MPSYSYRDYRRKTIDVQRLSRDYDTLSGIFNTKGRKALDHLTRSGVILLAGAWEAYIEDVLLEISTHFATLRSIDLLPRDVKKTISRFVLNHKNESKVLQLADSGWKTMYLNDIVKPTIEGFHTPKVHNIKEISKNLIGFEGILDCLTQTDRDFINDFIKFRGHIAHNVRIRGEKYLSVEQLDEYIDTFKSIVEEVDNGVLR